VLCCTEVPFGKTEERGSWGAERERGYSRGRLEKLRHCARLIGDEDVLRDLRYHICCKDGQHGAIWPPIMIHRR
jgi:hypothetical protein